MLKLRPHHIIDIIRDFGQNKEFVPHKYGHDYHTIAIKLTQDINQLVKLVISSDDICAPCMHLQADKKCNDIMSNHPYSHSKQIYNNYLDGKIIGLLSLHDNTIISVKDYLHILAKKTEIFDNIYPHSKEIIEQRKADFKNGLILLGIVKK